MVADYPEEQAHLFGPGALGLPLLQSDGACRGGVQSSIGTILYGVSGECLTSYSCTLGSGDSLDAEWHALILGLDICVYWGIRELAIECDNLTMVMQFKNLWGCFEERSNVYRSQAWALLGNFDKICCKHVLREFNKVADALANMALDDPFLPLGRFSALAEETLVQYVLLSRVYPGWRHGLQRGFVTSRWLH